MKQLVKFSKCFPGDITLEAFTVTDHQEVEQLFALAEIYFEFFDELRIMYDEFNNFENYKDYRDSFTVIDITDDEAKVFQKYFYYYLPENPIEFGSGSWVFDQNIFYDEIFNPSNKDKLQGDLVEKLKKIEPEFETWMNLP